MIWKLLIQIVRAKLHLRSKTLQSGQNPKLCYGHGELKARSDSPSGPSLGLCIPRNGADGLLNINGKVISVPWFILASTCLAPTCKCTVVLTITASKCFIIFWIHASFVFVYNCLQWLRNWSWWDIFVFFFLYVGLIEM